MSAPVAATRYPENRTLVTLFTVGDKLTVKAASTHFLLDPPTSEEYAVIIPHCSNSCVSTNRFGDSTIGFEEECENPVGKSAFIIAKEKGFVTTYDPFDKKICATSEDKKFCLIEASFNHNSPEEIAAGYSLALSKAKELGIKKILLPLTSNGPMDKYMEGNVREILKAVERRSEDFDQINVNILQIDSNFLIMRNIIACSLEEVGHSVPKPYNPPSYNFVENSSSSSSQVGSEAGEVLQGQVTQSLALPPLVDTTASVAAESITAVPQSSIYSAGYSPIKDENGQEFSR